MKGKRKRRRGELRERVSDMYVNVTQNEDKRPCRHDEGSGSVKDTTEVNVTIKYQKIKRKGLVLTQGRLVGRKVGRFTIA